MTRIASSDGAQPASGKRSQGAGDRGTARPIRAARRGSGAEYAGTVFGAAAKRTGALGEDHQGGEDTGGVDVRVGIVTVKVAI